MSQGLNLERHALVDRYVSTTLKVIDTPAVEDRIGHRHPELVALVTTAFTAERHMGRLVMPPLQRVQNNVAIHPILRKDRTIPNYTSFIDTPVSDTHQPNKGFLPTRLLDAAMGLGPRFFDDHIFAQTTRSETSHRDLIKVFPKLERVASTHLAAILTHEFEHARANRQLDKEGTPLSYSDNLQLTAGEKAAYQVSEAILETDPSLPTKEVFEAFWTAVKDAPTPAIAVEQANRIFTLTAKSLPDGHLGELVALTYSAKALSLRFGNEGSIPTANEIEAYKLYNLI